MPVMDKSANHGGIWLSLGIGCIDMDPKQNHRLVLLFRLLEDFIKLIWTNVETEREFSSVILVSLSTRKDSKDSDNIRY